MKKILFALVFSILVFSCAGEDNETTPVIQLDKSTVDLALGQSSQINLVSPADAILTWTTDNPGIATVSASGIVTAINTGTATITATTTDNLSAQVVITVTSSLGSWQDMGNLPVQNRYGGISFVIGNKAYLGLGSDFVFYTDNFSGTNSESGSSKSDFWQYDMATNIWTQLPDFPAGPRSGATAFSIGSKGYVGLGGNNKSDFWQFDTVTNTWTQLSDFPAQARSGAMGLSINNKGYVGFGYSGGINQYNDFWEYNPDTDTWNQKASMPGQARGGAAAFIIGDYIYTGFGYYSTSYIGADGNTHYKSNYLADFWQYDTTSDTWVQKADLTDSSDITKTKRYDAVAFSLNGLGYVGLGYGELDSPVFGIREKHDFWKYNPSANNWFPVANFPNSCAGAYSFIIDNQAFVGGGNYKSICGNHCYSTKLNTKFCKYIP